MSKRPAVRAAVLCAVLCLPVFPEGAWALAGNPLGGDSGSPIQLVPVATGLESPLFVTHAGDQSGRLFIVEQPGRIRVVKDGKLTRRPFSDISRRVSFGGERGLLGLAFHPDYARNGRYFVNYSREDDGATIVAEYHVSNDSDVSQDSERVLLVVEQPYGNHNGGMIAFGPDGYLYIGMGDGGAGGDPGNRGQNNETLLGKMLRLDVDRGKPYSVPPDNPFASPFASGKRRPEIFAYGFRNPWRFSFDRESGKLWVADVGQNAWEEIHVVRRGKNYGWRIMEGTHCYSPSEGCAQTGLEPPVAEYAHERGRCSITGGYVYRGPRNPAFRGMYLFGDYCSGEIWGLSAGHADTSESTTAVEVLLATDLNISSFGEDEAGELYAVDPGGAVYEIVPRPQSPSP